MATRLAIYPGSDAPEPMAVARGVAGPDGTFRLGGLSEGAWVLVATDDAGNRAIERFEIPVTGAHIPCDLQLRPARATLRGRVLRADGSAWAGCVGTTAHTGPTARVHDDGTFHLEGLPAGEFQVVGWTD